MGKLIPVKITKGILYFTELEYIEALKRGKAIKRKQALGKRIKDVKEKGSW